MCVKSNQQLFDLVLLAGSQARLAACCGVEPYVVWGWLQKGISRRGALLVVWSREFKDFIEITDLRPDMKDPNILQKIITSKTFRIAREKQVKFETSKDFDKKSPIKALERLLEKKN